MAAALSVRGAGPGAEPPAGLPRVPEEDLPPLDPAEVRSRLEYSERQFRNRRKVLIRGLPADVTNQDVHELLKDYELRYCFVDKYKGTGYGFAELAARRRRGRAPGCTGALPAAGAAPGRPRALGALERGGRAAPAAAALALPLRGPAAPRLQRPAAHPAALQLHPRSLLLPAGPGPGRAAPGLCCARVRVPGGGRASPGGHGRAGGARGPPQGVLLCPGAPGEEPWDFGRRSLAASAPKSRNSRGAAAAPGTETWNFGGFPPELPDPPQSCGPEILRLGPPWTPQNRSQKKPGEGGAPQVSLLGEPPRDFPPALSHFLRLPRVLPAPQRRSFQVNLGIFGSPRIPPSDGREFPPDLGSGIFRDPPGSLLGNFGPGRNEGSCSSPGLHGGNLGPPGVSGSPSSCLSRGVPAGIGQSQLSKSVSIAPSSESLLTPAPPTPDVKTPQGGRKRRFSQLLPAPEPSPEGSYVGQHSQGLGGHYADSYLKRKRIF